MQWERRFTDGMWTRRFTEEGISSAVHKTLLDSSDEALGRLVALHQASEKFVWVPHGTHSVGVGHFSKATQSPLRCGTQMHLVQHDIPSGDQAHKLSSARVEFARQGLASREVTFTLGFAALYDDDLHGIRSAWLTM